MKWLMLTSVDRCLLARAIFWCRAGTIGFLATSNRVNVMLSRAKHGMYILGNQETLTAKKQTRPTMMTNVWRSAKTVDVASPSLL